MNGIHLCPWCNDPVANINVHKGCCCKDCLRKATKFQENLKKMKGKGKLNEKTV